MNTTGRSSCPVILALAIFIAGFMLFLPGVSSNADHGERPRVVMETSMGTIIVELYPSRAPKTVENFLLYVSDGFYDGTIFHRVIKGFMIQGGGFVETLDRKNTRDPIPIESNNGLKNQRGAVAMARTGDPHSATSQFFINTVDNEGLNYSAPTVHGYGYTVFGKVVQGLDVVDRIEGVRTAVRGHMRDVPVNPVLIKQVYVQK